MVADRFRPHLLSDSPRTNAAIQRMILASRLRGPVSELSAARACMAVWLLFAPNACQTAGGPSLVEIATEVNSTLEPAAIVLGVGDTIALRFPYSPTWNQEVEITADGSASFMAVGRLILAGMSLGQLKETLSDAYARVFEDHELDVVLKERGPRKVYVMGEVLEPG